MAIVGFAGFACLVSFSAACNLIVKDFFDTFTSYSFTVIPFVLMGQIASNTTIAQRLYVAAHKWVGHVPGGLAMTTVAGATIFKAMCGSTLATVAAFSSIAIPEMDRYGYKKELSTGVVALRDDRRTNSTQYCADYLRHRGRTVDRQTFPAGIILECLSLFVPLRCLRVGSLSIENRAEGEIALERALESAPISYG
jgi:hypothetical protein